MKNSVLAPIIALLLLLAVSWAGLFGLSEASAAHDRATTSTSASARDGSFLDGFGSRDTTARAPENTSAQTHDRTHESGGLQSFLDRVAGRDQAEVSATANNPRDPEGLSNRGAAVLLLVIGLIALASGRK